MTQPAHKHHILIVDDDTDLRDLLHQYLTREDYQVDCAPDAIAMDARLETQHYDLMILDLMLPGEDGLSILRRLNPDVHPPVIILSARGQDVDRIIGLEVGADDYLAKPFNPRELLARIKSVLRRQHPAPTNPEKHLVSFGPFQLNHQTHCLNKHGVPIALTETEYKLLTIFSEHQNTLLDRDFLIDHIHGYERSPFDRSIDIRITRLRKKLEDNPSRPCYIRTIWGKGYQFTPEGK